MTNCTCKPCTAEAKKIMKEKGCRVCEKKKVKKFKWQIKITKFYPSTDCKEINWLWNSGWSVRVKKILWFKFLIWEKFFEEPTK